jgi:hypothetical protein
MIMSGTGNAMLLKDRFEMPVTCVSAAAVEDYVAGSVSANGKEEE